jgi:DNA gyrase subunit A
MSKIATHMLADIDKETVDFAPNYDDRLKSHLFYRQNSQIF